MPYIDLGRRAELKTEPQRATTPGDWNYLYSEAILKIWNSKTCYETIHKLKKDVNHDNPRQFAELIDVDSLLIKNNVSYEERKVAIELAFAEFYRRLGAQYEFHKITTVGDLEGYTEGLAYLNNLAREDFNSRIKYTENK